jgi:hypothetical protein
VNAPSRRATGLVSLLGALLLTPVATGAAAAPRPLSTQATLRINSDDLDKLTKQIATLEKKYGGDMALLRDTQAAAKDALTKSATLQKDLDAARVAVAQLAAAQYMGTPLDPSVNVLAGDDPSTMLDSASIASHLTRNKAGQVAQIKTLLAQQAQAAQKAKSEIATLKQQLADMDTQKAKLKKLVNKYKPQSPLVGNSHLTQRMVNVRTEVDTRFGPFPAIGCYRAGDPQDHGVGKACDFMESSGGVMPTAARQAHGDQVAAWAIANASRLGIKYVIWKQRIYDLRSPGWKAMSDRGGITANHFDHVHVSVF